MHRSDGPELIDRPSIGRQLGIFGCLRARAQCSAFRRRGPATARISARRLQCDSDRLRAARLSFPRPLSGFFLAFDHHVPCSSAHPGLLGSRPANADGQTGSGKTFTVGEAAAMGMPDEGIASRLIQELFEAVAADTEHKYTISIQCLQLYKERLYDGLLDASSAAGLATGGGFSHGGSQQQCSSPLRVSEALQLREDRIKGIHVPAATTLQVSLNAEAVARHSPQLSKHLPGTPLNSLSTILSVPPQLSKHYLVSSPSTLSALSCQFPLNSLNTFFSSPSTL